MGLNSYRDQMGYCEDLSIGEFIFGKCIIL